MAEARGFEPPRRLRAHTISSRALSTTQPRFRLLLYHISILLSAGAILLPMRKIKNKNDKRFLNTEQKINQTFITFLGRGDHSICVKELCEEAKIFYSTFYDHYQNTDVVLQSIEQKLKNAFLDSVSQDVSLKIILRNLLIFISKNQKYFTMTCKLRHYQLLLAIFGELRTLLIGTWRPRKRQVLDYWFELLCSELIATLHDWGQQSGFDLKDAPVVQRRLEKLILTAETRFRSLKI